MIQKPMLLFAITTALVVARNATAAEPRELAAAAAPWIDGETIAVITTDLRRWRLDPIVATVAELAPDLQASAEQWARQAEEVRDELIAAGFHEAAAVVSLHNMASEQPLILLLKTPDANVERLREFVAQQTPLVVEEREQAVVVSGPEVIERLSTAKRVARPSLAEALAAADDGALNICLLPSDDHRRVLDELLPTLPPEVGGEPSTALTRGVQWAAAGIDFPPEPALRLVVQSADEASAASLLRTWQAGLQWLVQQPGPDAVEALRPLVQLVTPKQDGDRVRVTLGGEADARRMLEAVGPPLKMLRMAAFRNESMNNLKHLIVALLNFESAHGRLPAVGTYDAAGQPLLSWRVHVLPFIEQDELYRQFHLDEPWDSPHNKPLLAKMPALYRCPASAHPASSGMATYREVVGDSTLWPGREGLTLKEATDGTSNTMSLVEVDDDHAVPWTKPEGLPFNPQGPPDGIGGQFPGGFNAGFADGHVRFMAMPSEKRLIVPLLTRNGEEDIER